MAADADGVHVGGTDLPVSVARRLLGPEKIIGGTAATLDEARRAEDEGADYIGFGHLYPTESKSKTTPPKRPEHLQAVRDAVGIPVIGIGGIDADRAPAVLGAGGHGVAVIAAVCGSPDPEIAARDIREAINRTLKRG